MTLRGGPGQDERLAFTFSGRRTVAPPQVQTGPQPVTPASRASARVEKDSGDTAFTALLAFTAVLFMRPQDVFPPLGALHLAELSAIVGLVAMVRGRMARRQPLSRMTPEFAGVLALGAVILFTAPFSLWFGGSVAVFTDLYAKVILVYLLAVNVVSSPRRLERLTWLLVLAVGFIAFRAVFDYARGVNVISNGTRVRGSVGGIMGNPNDLALNMVVFLPFAICVALWPGSVIKRLTAAGCALFMVGTVVASGSRGGFLGFVAMLLVLGALLLRRRPGYVIAAMLGLMCALPVLPATYWTRLASITDSSKDETGSREARRVLMRESLQAYRENVVIGVGAGEFKDWNNTKRIESWHESHNVLLQVAAELGTVGLAVFLFLLVRGLSAVRQTRRLVRLARRPAKKGGPPATSLSEDEAVRLDAHAVAIAAAFTGWCVCAFFASVAYNWTFYYLLALAATPRDILRGRLPRPARAGGAWAAASRRIALATGGEARA
jgi:O-antigen ligase